MSYPAYTQLPNTAELLRAARHNRRIIVCLPDTTLPQISLSEHPAAEERTLQQNLQSALASLQWHGPNLFQHLLPQTELWLMPPACAGHLADYFHETPDWQNPPIPQQTASVLPPWYSPPPPIPVEHIIIVGAGIAGAATARSLAERGLSVTVLEAGLPAQAASGNRQGLLYAKISAHPTEQTELLLCSYGYSRRLLTRLLPESAHWGAGGVLHLDHNPAEHKRNLALAQQAHYAHLFHHLNAEEATARAGIPLSQSGLFWPQGVWLNPPAYVHALLNHPAITLHTNSPLTQACHNGRHWQVRTPQHTFNASHLIYCTGAQSKQLPALAHLPFLWMRGQTTLTRAGALSQQLKLALSGASYLAPAWQGLHTYGASFIHRDGSSQWRSEEDQTNFAALQQLHPQLAAGLPPNESAQPGHAAVRCDSPDHLPLVGALGDHAAMQQCYAQLARDRKYRLSEPCPYQPGLYLNTAHGSRGLATAPLCAESIAAEISDQPNPLSPRLRAALHPNRYIIRAIGRQQPL